MEWGKKYNDPTSHSIYEIYIHKKRGKNYFIASNSIFMREVKVNHKNGMIWSQWYKES